MNHLFQKNPCSATRALALACTLSVPLIGQENPSEQKTAPVGEEAPIELSVFEVQSSKDLGYLAGNTLAGSRLNTELKDTAASISVMTPEFLKDLGATSMKDVILFSNNAVPEYGDSASNFNANPMIGNSEWQLRIRGLEASYARNYFAWNGPTDFYNIERVDQSRGPNSILFGFGAAGGIVNSSTKQAQVGKASNEVSFTTGSWNRLRGTVDSNQVLIPGKLALRVNGVLEDSDSWREFEYYKQQRLHLAAKYRINQKSSIRAEAEFANIDDNWGRPWLAIDQSAAWTAANKPLYDGAQWSSDIVTQTWSQHLVYTENNKSLGDWNNLPFSYSNSQGWARMAMTPENLAIIPMDSNSGGPDAERNTKYTTYSAFYENELTQDLSLEVAYNHQQLAFLGYDPSAGNLSRYGYLGDPTGLYGDASNYAPSWVANPNKGRYYFENNWTRRTSHSKDDFLRATLAYHLDAGKWGNHRLAGLVEQDWKNYERYEESEVLAGSPFDPLPEFDSNRLFRRHYFTPGDTSTIRVPSWKDSIEGLKDPVSGKSYTTAWAPNQDITNSNQEQSTLMGALQSEFFNKKLITIAGYRLDKLEYRTAPTIRGNGNLLVLDPANTKTTDFDANTLTLGLVYHITDLISLAANHSNSRNLPNLNQRIIPNDMPPMPEGEGNDIGVRFNLVGGKLYATATYYTTELTNTTEWGNIQSSVTNLNSKVLSNLKKDGLITDAEATARTINANGYLQDRKADGWEFSLIANPTNNWRISGNFSINNVEMSNIMTEVDQWLGVNSAWWLQKAAPLGGANYLLGGGTWDTLGANIGWTQDYVDSMTAFNGRSARGQRQYGANLYTHYGFDHGLLKGFSVGGGGRYQSKNVIGMNGTETVEGRELVLLDASLGYSFHPTLFGKKTQFDLQLNISNLLDTDRYQIYTVAWWDKTATIPERIGLQEPRKYTLSASMKF